jgi:hypothetical protein
MKSDVPLARGSARVSQKSSSSKGLTRNEKRETRNEKRETRRTGRIRAIRLGDGTHYHVK